MAILKTKQRGVYRFLLILCLFALTHVRANELGRTFDPIILTNSDGNILRMPEFDGLTPDQIKVYAYSSVTGWRLIPFQIDNVPYFTENDGIFDGDDEVVFLARDCGEWASAGVWISDNSSRNYPRYQIEVTDPVTLSIAYAYIFATDNPAAHPDPESFMSYDAGRDRVITRFYELGARGADANGNYETAIVPFTAGGDSVDFLDRLKVRMRGNVSYGVFNLDVDLSEDNLVERAEPRSIVGAVRVVRQWTLNLDVPISTSQTFTVELEPFTLNYYPYFSEFEFEVAEIPEEYLRVDYARLSLDLDPDADGMRMFSSISTGWETLYPDGVPIDNDDDTGVTPRDLMTPGWNWWMQTGSPGTLLTVSYVPQTGAGRYLYYKDNPEGTNDGYSGAYDTGFDGSWGDTGVKFLGPGITSNIRMGGKYFFLGADISPDSAETIKQKVENPLLITVNGPIHVPVELAFFSAHVAGPKVRLVWLTESETQNLGFTLQRKQTGSSWQDIQFIKGGGTTTKSREYTFTDLPNKAGEYFYRLKQTDFDGSFDYSKKIKVRLLAPGNFAVLQNYPNPFNPSTVIEYSVPEDLDGTVRLSVYDMLGRRVRTLVQEKARAGKHKIRWDGLDDTGRLVSSGVYTCVLRIGRTVRTAKMVKMQ